MKLYCCVFFVLLILQSCKNRLNYVENINMQVEMSLIDTLVFSGNEEMIFTDRIQAITQNDGNVIAFDLITRSLLHFRSNGRKYYIDQIVDIQEWLISYPFMRENHFRVIEVFNTNILICAFPYYILLDHQLNPLDSFEVDDVFDSVPFHSQGSNYEIAISFDKMRVYHNVAPLVPATMNKYFYASRIVEINLETQQSRFIPVGLPPDYEVGLGYQQLGIPCFTIHNEKLFLIYPGSNFLYYYDPVTEIKDSVVLLPKHVEINVSLGDNFLDKVMYGPFESNTFYHMVSYGEYILLFYREGESRENITSQGLTSLKTFLMGYDPDRKKILFDIPFLALDKISKIPFWVANNQLFFPFFDDKDSFEHKVMVYELQPET